MTAILKIPRQPLDRWLNLRIANAQALMPQFDALPSEIRAALRNMKTVPKWALILSLTKSVKRGTKTDFLLRRIAKEDQRQLERSR